MVRHDCIVSGTTEGTINVHLVNADSKQKNFITVHKTVAIPKRQLLHSIMKILLTD